MAFVTTEPERSDAAPLPTPDEVIGLLRGVIDPELGLDIVELGMAKGAVVSPDGTVRVTIALTTSGCAFQGVNSLPLPGAVGRGADSSIYHVEIANVATLEPNSPVMMNDVVVGSVRVPSRESNRRLAGGACAGRGAPLARSVRPSRRATVERRKTTPLYRTLENNPPITPITRIQSGSWRLDNPAFIRMGASSRQEARSRIDCERSKRRSDCANPGAGRD